MRSCKRTPVLDHSGVPGLQGLPGWSGGWRREALWGTDTTRDAAEMATASTDASSLRRVRSICRVLPEVEEVELQSRPLFRVHRRRFVIYNADLAPPRPRWEGSGRSIHVLTDPMEREALLQDARFVPSPHHGDRGWVALRLDGDEVDWSEVAELIEAGYRQAAPKRLVALLDSKTTAPNGSSGSSLPPTNDDPSASDRTGPSWLGDGSCPSTPPPSASSTGDSTTPSSSPPKASPIA